MSTILIDTHSIYEYCHAKPSNRHVPVSHLLRRSVYRLITHARSEIGRSVVTLSVSARLQATVFVNREIKHCCTNCRVRIGHKQIVIFKISIYFQIAAPGLWYHKVIVLSRITKQYNSENADTVKICFKT